MKNKFPVTEIFDSIDGEGKRTGLMATFVRFAGCNLRCSYCDTAYSLREEDAEEWLTEEELLRRIRAYPWKRVTLTGRWPLCAVPSAGKASSAISRRTARYP